ncbi:MAG: hypothetical protein AB7R89_06580 [Dehalococcoidia bacterium]
MTAIAVEPEEAASLGPLPPGWTLTTLGEITEPAVDQSGPVGLGEFVYIDISSIDNRVKAIIDPKTVPVSQATDVG